MIDLNSVIKSLAAQACLPGEGAGSVPLCVLDGFVDAPVTAPALIVDAGASVEDETVWGGLFRLRAQAVTEPPRCSQHLVLPSYTAQLLMSKTGMPAVFSFGFFLRERDETGYQIEIAPEFCYSPKVPERICTYFY